MTEAKTDQALDTISTRVREMRFDGKPDCEGDRNIPVEAPISVEICGVGYAVMMATPIDLDDFAVGFALAEGLIESTDQIESIEAHAVEGGWALRIWLVEDRKERVFDRARRRVSESSCGLCGIENIEEVLRPLPPVKAVIKTNRDNVSRALEALRDHQPLSRATGAVHAAAFCTPDGDILHAREDVGRHNALDKLIGCLAREQVDAATGFIVLSARCSYELVEKTTRAGCPMLVTISAPTSLAVERAQAAGLTLVSLARSDSALVICDAKGMIS